jgi:hypothetical protein
MGGAGSGKIRSRNRISIEECGCVDLFKCTNHVVIASKKQWNIFCLEPYQWVILF